MITAARWDRMVLRPVLGEDGKRRHWADEASARAELYGASPRELFSFFEVEPVDLDAYWAALDRADWWWSMADDGGAYRAGAAEIGKLECQALLSPEHAATFAAFQRHYHAPPGTRDQIAPKPPRDSGRLPQGEDKRSLAECEASQSGGEAASPGDNP